jgi:hypothetical protein
MTNKEYADGLRLIADFYETHPRMPLPSNGGTNGFTVFAGRAEGLVAKSLSEIAAILVDGGDLEKTANETFYCVSREFGSLRFEVLDYRKNVCTVVGSHKEIKTVTRTITPAVTQVVQEEIEILDWECPKSLLALAKASELCEICKQYLDNCTC